MADEYPGLNKPTEEYPGLPEPEPARLPAGERKAIAVTILLGLVATLLAVGVNIWYTNRVSEEGDRDWCHLLVLLDDTNSKQPPSANPSVNEYRRLLHDLRGKKGC